MSTQLVNLDKFINTDSFKPIRAKIATSIWAPLFGLHDDMFDLSGVTLVENTWSWESGEDFATQILVVYRKMAGVSVKNRDFMESPQIHKLSGPTKSGPYIPNSRPRCNW